MKKAISWLDRVNNKASSEALAFSLTKSYLIPISNKSMYPSLIRGGRGRLGNTNLVNLKRTIN